ncbi:Caffeoylshikimate esterase [Bienertia sinuspersici]
MGTNVKYEEEFILNNNGLMLFTCRWLPENKDPKALIFLCHGYAMESSISMQGTANRLVKAGYGVYGIDYVGHGKSEGLHGFVPSFEDLVQDCLEHFTKVCEREESKGKPRYLMGESMGGAVLLLLHRKMPDFWDGAVLVAPMCKIADDMKPNPLVINFLSKLSRIVPTWKIVPGQDVIDLAVRANPYWYTGRPLLHGGDDKVTDPAISKLLYESATSFDKTFKLYPGMWHALTYGELPENTETVFNDIIGWLDDRSNGSNSRLERASKSIEDKDANVNNSFNKPTT